jgi:tetratricopeptide (TPR) repeat protein
MPPHAIPATEPDLKSETSVPGTPPKRRLRVWRGVGLCGIVLLIVAAVPSYRWWKQRRTTQFKAGCVEATAEKHWERLGLIAARWSEWDPTSSDAHVYLAEAHFQAGRLEEAAESLARVSDDYHGVVSALILRGEILYGDLHRPYEAEENWRRILRIDPQSTHAHQRLISFYALSLQRRRMIEQIRESLRRRCEPPEAYAYLILANALGFTEGVVHVRSWRSSYPDDETLEVAEALYMADRPENPNVLDAYEESHFKPGDQSAIDACLEKYPRNIEVLAFHIERQIFFGRTEQVVRLLQSAPAEAMQDSRFWRYRGWLLQQAEDHEQAVEALETSIEIDRFSWRSRWELASLLRLLGRLAEAEQVQDVAIKGKDLQEELYRTDGRALTWGLVEEMRDYISRADERQALAALDARIRSLGGESFAAELIGDIGSRGQSDRP